MYNNGITQKGQTGIKTKMFTEEVVETSLEQKEHEATFNPFRVR